jgi:predicted protein tyrosine phosphatase
MPWIQNVSLSNIKTGIHINPGENAMLIQISDPPGNFPTSLYKFNETYQFQFLDVEERDQVDNEAMRCSHEQATELVQMLQHAMINQMNVIVHCHAGVCRSGAVCEIGVMLGFDDTEVFRSPNLLVKHRMMKALGWTYDSKELPTINGKPLDKEWVDSNERWTTLAQARREHRLTKRDY